MRTGQIWALTIGCWLTAVTVSCRGNPPEPTTGGASTESFLLSSPTVWQPLDITLTAAGAPDWKSFPVSVTFTHSSGTQVPAEGFWDGGKVWKVRFAPTKAGAWAWRSSSSDSGLDNKTGTITVAAATASEVVANPNLRGPLRIASNHRTFNRADGTPFFYLGDTGWGVGENTYANFGAWANDRKAKGFSVVQVRYLSPVKSNDGGYPYASSLGGTNTGDYSGINPGYFQELDKRFRYLFDRGFVVAGHPDWLISGNNQYDLTEAMNICRYLMARYGAFPLVWSVVGEYHNAIGAQPYWVDNNFARLSQLATFVQTKNFYDHPMSVHPGGDDPGAPNANIQSSAHHFHGQAWLDHDWLQTYKSPEKIPYRIDEALSYTPLKPVIMSEGQYEAIPNVSAPADLQRRQAWTALLSGAAGFVYGASGIIFFTDMSKLSLPGSSDMSRVASFFKTNAIPLSALNPKVAAGQTCVTVNGDTPSLLDATHPRCAGTVGSTYVLYAPVGSSGYALEMRGLANKTYIARWYNPATGVSTSINAGDAINTAQKDTWQVPSRPSTGDWVLWLSATATTSTTVPRPPTDFQVQ